MSVYTTNPHLIYAVSLTAKIHGSRNQGVEMDMAAAILTLTHTLAKVLFPVPLICWSTGLSSKGRNVPTRKYNNDATDPEVKRTIWPP